jgi:16S rRNA (uracil1498-N3)-methyltransferase
MPVFFLPPQLITPPTVTITGDLLTHVRQSLRMTIGDTLLIGDGQGRRYHTRVTAVTKHALSGSIIETLTEPTGQLPSIILGQALLKGDKMDWVIQKATELGVRTIIPLQTRHSVVQARAERIETQRARWQRIALEAAQQSEQWAVAAVKGPQLMAEFLEQRSDSAIRLILLERTDVGLRLADIDLPRSGEDTIVLLVGPEGGWAAEEIALIGQLSLTPITLGSKILRAETAAISALAVLQHRLGALG